MFSFLCLIHYVLFAHLVKLNHSLFIKVFVCRCQEINLPRVVVRIRKWLLKSNSAENVRLQLVIPPLINFSHGSISDDLDSLAFLRHRPARWPGNWWFLCVQVGKFHLLAAQRREQHILLMVLSMVSCYMVCWMPYGIVALMATFGRSGLITPVASVVPSILAKFSTVVNPIIYVFFNNQVQPKGWTLHLFLWNEQHISILRAHNISGF